MQAWTSCLDNRPLCQHRAAACFKPLMRWWRDCAQVIGVHMVGPDAPEIMQGVAIALKAGATKAHFSSTVGLHPTAAEELVTMHHPMRRIQCGPTAS